MGMVWSLAGCRPELGQEIGIAGWEPALNRYWTDELADDNNNHSSFPTRNRRPAVKQQRCDRFGVPSSVQIFVATHIWLRLRQRYRCGCRSARLTGHFIIGVEEHCRSAEAAA